MPTYEYICNSCNHEFECEQRISEPPKAKCPGCGSEDTRRLISLSSFVLKGTGWYVTDYARRGNGKKEKQSDKKAESSAPSTATHQG